MSANNICKKRKPGNIDSYDDLYSNTNWNDQGTQNNNYEMNDHDDTGIEPNVFI